MQENESKNYVFGIHSVLETLRSGKEIEKVLIQKGLMNEGTKEVHQLVKELKVPHTLVPIEKLNKITRKNHQGVILFASVIQYSSLENIIDNCFAEGRMPFLLLCDSITDVRNFGAIARTAECAGIDAIIVPTKGSVQINSDALKTSVGALNYIPVCRAHSLKATVHYLKESGINVVTCTEKATTALYDYDFTHPVAIVVGSEEFGISEEIRAIASDEVTIPMFGKVSSLNVSVAAAVITYEAVRQRSL